MMRFVLVLVLGSGAVAGLVEQWCRRLGYHLIGPESLLGERFTPQHAHTPTRNTPNAERQTRHVIRLCAAPDLWSNLSTS